MRYPISNASLDNDGDIAILGRKGSGKTYTAKGLVERLIKRGRRVIVIDPMSIWWGLRVDADGTSPGLPVVVIGGANGDIPLPSHAPEAGAHVAKVLLASNVSAVIDVADMRRPSNLLFVAALLRELYENHRGEAIWIVLEEADIWAPQTGRSAEDQVVFAEVEILARRGRSRGFRLVSITQRPARIHKDVLSQLSDHGRAGLAWITRSQGGRGVDGRRHRRCERSVQHVADTRYRRGLGVDTATKAADPRTLSIDHNLR